MTSIGARPAEPPFVLTLDIGTTSARADIERYVGRGPIILADQPRLESFLGLSSNSGPRRNPNRGLRE